MYRSVSKIVKESFKQAKYLPEIVGSFDNWFTFILNYLRISKKKDHFVLRNGLSIFVDRINDDGWSPSILMDILIKKDYGEIDDNSIIVDIGANYGVFSLYAVYKKNNICYSYEPEDNNFKILTANIRANGLAKQIIPFKYAVSAIDGKMKLFETISMSHSLNVVSENFHVVETITIRKIIEENKLDKIDYLKVDCEGGEYEIFYNCDEIIFRKVKNILLEYHNFDGLAGQNGDDLIVFLRNKGYTVKLHKKITNKLGIVHFHYEG